jgi:hypothetical protein
MAAPDAKKIGALVVDGLPPPDKLDSMGGDDEGGDGEDPGKAAVRDFFEAGKRGDYEAAYSALSDAVALCDKGDDQGKA